MGFIANLLKKKSKSHDEVNYSLNMLDMLKEKRGAETGKYLALMVDPRMIPPPAEESTIAGVDQREQEDSSVYTPPMDSIISEEAALAGTANPTEVGINNFFDTFVGLARSHNDSQSDADLKVSIQRPSYLGEKYPADDGFPVFSACIHTAHWGLYFFGHGATTDVYILPYEEESAVSLNELKVDGTAPLLTATTKFGQSGREWYIGDRPFYQDNIPDLAEHLLSDLLHAAKH